MIQERKKIVLSVFIVFALVAILLICLAPRVTPKLTTLSILKGSSGPIEINVVNSIDD